MGTIIAKFGDFYCEWETITDYPVTELMDQDDFIKFFKSAYDEAEAKDLMERLARADRYGTSSLTPEIDDDFKLTGRPMITTGYLLRNNQAGEEDEQIETVNEMIAAYRYPLRPLRERIEQDKMSNRQKAYQYRNV